MTTPLKLYTKTGDQGKTSLIGSARLSKSHPVFEVLGTTDELNSYLGHAVVLTAGKTRTELLHIQNNLLTIGAMVAGSDKTTLTQTDLFKLETRIDYYQKNTAKDWYTKFLLPGGTELAARLDIARSVTRRLERRLLALETHKTFGLEIAIKNWPQIKTYTNRLSDYLFALRCYENSKVGFEEKEFQTKPNKPI